MDAMRAKTGEGTESALLERLWSTDESERASGEPALIVDVAGFEGPLDLLLHLARSQKLDLARVSVLALAQQYLEFIESARKVRIELAADYLVMAAWLAFLKSRLLIPQQAKDDGPSGEEMAATLAFRLKRLEAMRHAGERLINRDRLGRDVFARGAPEHLPGTRPSAYDASLYDLLTAYAALRQRQAINRVIIEKRRVWSLADARGILNRLLGDMPDWAALDAYLLEYLVQPEDRVSAMASTFAASLEMVREGTIEIRQDGAFAPIYMRSGQKPLTPEETPQAGGERHGR